MKILGYILLIGGIIALILTGVDYISETERLNFLGLDVIVSEGNPVPMIISLVVAVIGLVMVVSKR